MARQHKIYGDELFQHKPTIRALVWHYFYNKFINLERHKKSIYRENAQFIDPELSLKNLKTKTLAVIKDGKVVEILRMQEDAANHLLSCDGLSEFDPQKTIVRIGMELENEKED